MVIYDHHPGYISWEQFVRNEQRLAANNTSKGARPPGPAAVAPDQIALALTAADAVAGLTCSPAALTVQAAGIRWVGPPSFQVAATSRGVR